MSFSLQEIENAQKGLQALTQLHQQRKEQEIIWAQKNEQIFEATDINFPDINGFTLLDYAIILQDNDQIQKLVSDGAKSNRAVVLAKTTENQNIINFIANVTEVAHEETPLEKFDRLLSHPHSDLNTTFSHQAVFVDFDIFLEKIGQEQFNTIKWNEIIDTYDKEGYTPLMRAINAGNFTYVKFLVEKGCDVNKSFNTAPFTAIDFAIHARSLEIAMFLKDQGARLNQVDHEGKCLLTTAILSNNVELVKFALAQDIDYAMIDHYGKSPVHYAAESQNPEIIALVLKDMRCQPYKQSLDIFGQDPIQIAVNHDNQDFIRQIDWSITHLPEKKENIPINQDFIIKKLQYYLRLTNQNPTTLSIEGHCNGLEFLALVLSDKAKRKDFFDTLKIISTWNGSYEELRHSHHTSALNDEYSNTEDLIRYFIDHIIFLQQTDLDWELKEINPSQKSRAEQYAIISENTSDISLEKHFDLNADNFLGNHHPLNEPQLAEYIAILSRLPNTKIELGGANHATSLYAFEPQTLYYYDPNIKFEIPPTASHEAIAKMIKHFKYDALLMPSKEMSLMIIPYKSKHFSPEQYSFFNDHELPTTQQEAQSYQNNSPNKLTHLHVAVLIDSLADVKKLLVAGFVDLNARDTNGDRAIDLAIKYKKPDMLAEIVNSPHFNLPLSELLSLVRRTHDDKIKELLFHAIGKVISSDQDVSGEMKILLLKESQQYNIDKLFTFLKEHYLAETTKQLAKGEMNQFINQLMRSSNASVMKGFLIELIKNSPDINQPDPQGLLPIHAFVKSEPFICNDADIFSALKNKGIDLNAKTADGETPLVLVLKNPSDYACKDELIGQLIANGADVNATEPQYNISPLFLCLFYYGNAELSERLLQAGAKVNHQIFNDATVLHEAAMRGNAEMVNMLLKYGANFRIKDNLKKTPLAYATEHGHTEVAQLFLNRKLKITGMIDLTRKSSSSKLKDDTVPMVANPHTQASDADQEQLKKDNPDLELGRVKP